ncbi:Uma2 family endonuclease [Tunicatimonas pelagia]|uniref:Uma2 family endonuclease n=1 Tax=Tunicatimonas pelagia TaxID=931531 RepID=UPI00266599C9|nr:Uma2 family endonuclease [Tunicatimonas pelagia]WKN43717.1 Uma2 family endonuclease [Tunicatimonas pelagia]
MSNSTETLSEYELERGKPMPSTIHSLVQGNLVYLLKANYNKTYHILPELSLDTPEKPSVPDIAIYPKFEIDWRNDTIKRNDVPLATVEILSPTQSLDELVEKAHRYFQSGVSSCWIVLPSMKAIAVYTSADTYNFFNETDTLLDSPLSVKLAVADVFK